MFSKLLNLILFALLYYLGDQLLAFFLCLSVYMEVAVGVQSAGLFAY